MLTRTLDTLRALFLAPVARHTPLWITPNRLTLLRLALVLLLWVLLQRQLLAGALALYLLAAFTDALDGAVARLRGSASRLGALADPAVDKALHLVIFVSFLSYAPFLLALLIALDLTLFVAGICAAATLVRRGALSVGANVFGKWKFLLQTLAVLLLFTLSFFLSEVIFLFLNITLVGAAGFAALSLLGYLKRLRAHDVASVPRRVRKIMERS